MSAIAKFAESGYHNNFMLSPRDNEYNAFSYVTRLLRAAQGNQPDAALIYAVYQNDELWTTLAADLADKNNLLPDDVKAGLITLSIFSLKHGRKVVQGAAEVSDLIEVNLSVMKGLRGEAAQ